MKQLLLALVVFLFSLNSVLAQDISTMSKSDLKEVIGTVSYLMIKEGLISADSNGVLYSKLKSKIEIEQFCEKVRITFVEASQYHTRDLLIGMGESSLSGIGLGMLESHAFGYRYPHLGPGALRDYLLMNQAGDAVFTKFWHSAKVGRSLNDIFDRAGYNRLRKFYGDKWFWAYLTHFVVKNTTATFYRDWAKYGDLTYSYQIDLWFPEESIDQFIEFFGGLFK